jgi:hypothetical protein
VVGEKRGPEVLVEEGRPTKNMRTEGSSTIMEGLHRLEPGVPAQRFVLPAVFAHGGEVFDGNTEVVVPEVDQAINDRNSYCISSVILVIIYSTLDQLQGKFLKKRSYLHKKSRNSRKS